MCTKGHCIGQVGHHGCYSLHIQSLRVWSGLRLGTISTMPSLDVYKGALYRSGWASWVLFITYTIIEGLVGPVLVHNLDHAFTGCVQNDIVSVRLGIKGVFSLHVKSSRVWLGLCSCTISTMPSLVVYKGILHRSGWASQVLIITYTIIEGLVGPVLVHNLDHAFTGCVQNDIVSVRLGIKGVFSLHVKSSRVWLGLCSCTISTMPSLVVYKGILHRSGWASQVLIITYTIIEGLVGPVLVHNLDHAFTGCVQKDIVSVRLGITGLGLC